MAMYIRVKRKKTTYFVHCNPWETILQVKSKLETLIDNHAYNQRLILLSTRQILNDGRTLAEQKVENDAIVALTLRNGNGDWEDIDIDKPTHYRSLLNDSEFSG